MRVLTPSKTHTPHPTPQSYISLDSTTTATDESGLPEVYNAELIQDYWKSQRGTLNKRWGEFVGLSVPFLTRLTSLFITEGGANLGPYVGELSRSAREILQELGPTFVKLGQMMSVRPDVLPEEALTELGILQVRRGVSFCGSGQSG
jgi:hypothetical protein